MKIDKKFAEEKLALFGELIDRWSGGSSISPYLIFSIRPLLMPNVLWQITDTSDIISHNILVKPVKTIYVDIENNMIIRDYAIDLEDRIQYLYKVYLPEKRFYKVGGWANKEFYRLMQKKYPRAFEEHEKRIEISKKIATREGFQIEPVVTPAGYAYQQIKINIKDHSTKKIIETITKVEDLFIKIYSTLENIPLESFKTDWRVFNQGAINLKKSLHYMYELLRNVPEQVYIEYLSIENTTYSNYYKDILWIKTPLETIVKINVMYSTDTKENMIRITINDKENYNNLIRELKNYYPETNGQETISITKEGIPASKIISDIQTIIKTYFDHIS